MRARWSTNLILKILSLLVAVLVWNFYRTEPTSTRVLTVPLQYGDPPQHLALTEDPPATILLRLRAPEATFRNLADREILARIDLSGLTTGQQFIPVTPSNIQVPAGAEVLRIEPDLVSLRVERKQERPIPVEAETIGEPAPGYQLVGVTLEPERVQVEGPESAVRKIEKLRTGSIDITGRQATFSEEVSVVTDNVKVRISEEGSTVARVEIREIPAEWGFFDIPVFAENAPGVASLDPPLLGLSVIGPPSILKQLTSASFRIVVDASGLQPGSGPHALTPIVRFAPPSLALTLQVAAYSHESVAVQLTEFE
jgi:hypothetical protein